MKSGDKVYRDSFRIASSNPDPVASSITHLLHLLDRPIAFHRCFVTLTGSVTAALMLSQAIYWQKRAKDHDGWWYKTRDEWSEETGMSRREQESARKRLRELGITQEERRGVPATMWYRVDETRLLELLAKAAETAASDSAPVAAKPPVQMGGNVPTGWAETYQLDGRKRTNQLARSAPTFKEQRLHRDYTETTTTTPNPSSTDERAAEPEPARGGGGQDENRNRAGDHGPAALEPNEGQPATRGEAPNGQRPELTYPAKLTEREREDIATQLEPLPVEIAQQMLDVVEAKIGAGQIKTSAAAVLRGIVRKHRADPTAFDPSIGFRVADVRRQRAEAEARARAETERRERAAPIPPEAREIARQSLASIKRMLRGHA